MICDNVDVEHLKEGETVYFRDPVSPLKETKICLAMQDASVLTSEEIQTM